MGRYLILVLSVPKRVRVVDKAMIGLGVHKLCPGVFESSELSKARGISMLIERLGGETMLLGMQSEEAVGSTGVVVVKPKDLGKGYRSYLVEIAKRFGLPIPYAVVRGCLTALLPSARELESLRSYLMAAAEKDEILVLSQAAIVRYSDRGKLPNIARRCFAVPLCRNAFDKAGLSLEDLLARWS